MILGETLASQAGNIAVSVWSPWFASLGDKAVFSCQLLAVSLNAQLEVGVWTKNNTDSDVAATFLGSMNLTARGAIGACEVSGCKELVRYTYTPVDLGGLGDQWVHFVMQTPSWSQDKDLLVGTLTE